jgi:hypothetical protein
MPPTDNERDDFQFNFTCGKCGLEMVLWASQEWSILRHLTGVCVESLTKSK